MSFLATLNLDGEEVKILDCSFSFKQDADYTGRPCAKPRGGQINFLIEATSKTDFLDWMIDPTATKKGKITFYRRDSMSSMKNVEFSDAYCLEYTEHFNHSSSDPYQIQFTISAKEITVKGTKYVNNWPVKA